VEVWKHEPAQQGMGGAGRMMGNMQGGSFQQSSMDNSRRESGGGRRDSRGGGSGGVKSVFVRNLPFSTTWQQIKDKFRDSGHVVRADIKTDDKGRSKGWNCGIRN